MKNLSKEEYAIIKTELFDRHYQHLNPMQRKAVFSVMGPLLVIAGAGSGKTTVLVNRIAQIINFGDAYFGGGDMYSPELLQLAKEARDSDDEGRVKEFLLKTAVNPAKPHEVLCITFTNKAANEFKERLANLLGESATDIWAGTFHSICVRILRRHINLLGYNNSFTIYDTDDSKKLITESAKHLNMENGLPSPVDALKRISRAKEEGLFPEDYADTVGKDQLKLRVSRLYNEYQARLRLANALDFDDIILLTLLLFKRHPEVLKRYQQQFNYILVDEFQDTNPSQSDLIHLLGGKKQNVCVVGDDDQSIYAFRGATIENILNFDKAYDSAKVIRLEQNYRSTGNILAAANGLIKHNTGRREKNLWCDKEEGEPILIKQESTHSGEATYIMEYIRKAVNSHKNKYKDFAVLYRLNSQSNSLETIISKNRIPYRIFGGVRFYERKEIKDILAYLSLVNNPDDDVRFRRIINTPRRQIGTTTLALIDEIAQREGVSLFNVVTNAKNYPELSKALARLKAFASLIEGLRELSATAKVSEVISETIIRTKYKEMLEESEENSDRADNVEELISSGVTYETQAEDPSLSAFLEEVALVSDIDNYDSDANAVNLMTIHSAKGLEFPVVFITGFEENLFPTSQSIEEGERSIEEERRLAYVAITRAQERVIILHTRTRLLYGRTSSNRLSRFANEIPAENKIIDAKPIASTGTVSEAKKKFDKSKASFIQNIERGQPTETESSSEFFDAGAKVTHPMLGDGVVVSAQKMGGDILYEVEFSDGSVKRLMGTYARLEKA